MRDESIAENAGKNVKVLLTPRNRSVAGPMRADCVSLSALTGLAGLPILPRHERP